MFFIAFVKYKKGFLCLQDTFSLLNKIPSRIIHSGQRLLINFYYLCPSSALKDEIDFCSLSASAALVQHGGKLPLSNKVEGSENRCCCIMRFVKKSFFFLLETFSVAESFTTPCLVLNAFPAISEGLNLKHAPESP